MLRPPPGRRRPLYGTHLCCAAATALLLLFSLSVLHSHLSSSHFRLGLGLGLPSDRASTVPFDSDHLILDDADNEAFDGAADDRIDELDDLDDEDEKKKLLSEAASDDDEADSDDSELPRNPSSGGYFWDHALGVKRQSFGKPQGQQHQQSSDRWDNPLSVDTLPDEVGDRGKIAFGSDDQPVDEQIRLKLDSIRRIEDALLLKVGPGGGGGSPLRDGWARWFETKGKFLKQDRMFESSLEPLNPMNHPLLQDPDGSGLTGLTRGDRLMQKAMWKEIERTAFIGGRGHQIKRVERKTLDLEKQQVSQFGSRSHPKYADGRHWGYYPGLEQHSSFSEFMDRFLGGGRCQMRVLMVWNSPPWAYSVRHQRGLESVLHHHRDACVVVFSETMELDFFKDFVKDGFKIAVAMPNLDELLKDTPAHVFASVWFEWRKTKHYSFHYSELVRLAALYKYGGVYLDSDVIVLKPLHTLKNSIGVDNQMVGSSTFNGAVMVFEIHSPFIMECLSEFYSTYDDTLLRWNGAELLTRVIIRLVGGGDKFHYHLELKIESPHAFFPISAQNIARYFTAPVDDAQRAQEDILLAKIVNESFTFHFWNGLTSAMVPETGSLVEKLLNRHCLHCLDVL